MAEEKSALADKLEESTTKANIKKFDADELKKIKELQTTYQSVTARLGQLEVDSILLNQAMVKLEDAKTNLREAYAKAQEDEQAFVQNLNTKYGAGNVNIQTGEFTPANLPSNSPK